MHQAEHIHKANTLSGCGCRRKVLSPGWGTGCQSLFSSSLLCASFIGRVRAAHVALASQGRDQSSLSVSLSRCLSLSPSRSLALSLSLPLARSLSLSLPLARSLSLCPLPPLPHSLSRSRSRRNSSGIRLASPSLSPKPLLSRQVGHVASREEKRSAQCMGSDRSPIHARRSPLFAALGSRLLPARQRRTTPRAQLGCARSVGLPPPAQLRRSSSSRRLERSLASYEHIVSMRSRHW